MVWRSFVNSLWLGLVLCAATGGAGVVAAESVEPRQRGIKVGFAERDISPRIGMRQMGGYGPGAMHERIHDPCKARAVVFDDGERRVALVGLDVCAIWRDTVQEIRKLAHERCGIEPDAIMIGASHTHSGGPMGLVQPGQYDHADEMVQKLAYEMSAAADPEYLRLVIDQTGEAIVEADSKRAAAECGFGSGREEKVSFNRRIQMRNGATYTHPGQGNPDVVEYAGPIDPEVGVLAVWNGEKLTGCIVNFACHATTTPDGGNCSADYIYYIEQTIRRVMGEEVAVVFLNGASGDVTQVDNLLDGARPWSGVAASRFVGGRIGAEAVKALLGMWTRTDRVKLAASNRLLEIPRRRPAPERVEAAYALLRDPTVKPDYGGEWVWAKETVMLDALLKTEPVAQVEVQAIQVGPAAFVAVPAEWFCQFGLDLKERSNFPFTYPVSLANGCEAYVPTWEAFGPAGGGYETRLTSISNLRMTAGDEMLRAGVELLDPLTPDHVPQLPPTPPFRAPWTYGAAPPQRE